MSLGSGFLENIPHFTFTPTEHQVECVKVSLETALCLSLVSNVLFPGCRRAEPDLCSDGDPGEEFPGVDVGAGGLSVYP